jgi:glycosyltransferase involved in cell wall biosynthesis
MKKNPFVSVVICTYKKRESLRKAIDSVLDSSYRNFELIVVSDGGKIDLSQKGFILLEQKHRGLASARNTGIKNSKGEIIAFTDDDCIVERDWLKEIVNSFDSPEIGAVSGKSIEYFHEPKENLFWTCNRFGLIKVNPKKIDKNDFVVVHGCNMAFSRKALEEINFFDENFTYYFEEIDVAVRLLKKGFKIKINGKAVVKHYLSTGIRFGNKFEYGKFKYYFALKNFHSFFFFPFLVLNDLPFLFSEIRNSFSLLLSGKSGLREFFRDLFFVFAGRISGTRKAFMYFLK